MMPEIVVVGSHAPALFIDVARPPQEGEIIQGSNFRELKDGGKGSNQAIAAARLGSAVSFVGRVGNDRAGQALIEWLDSDSVDHKHLILDRNLSTGAGFNLQTENGDCALVTCMGANEYITKEQIHDALQEFKGAKVLLTQFEIPPEIALYASHLAVESGMISIVNPAPATPVDSLKQHKVSLLIPNRIEATTLLGLHSSISLNKKDLCDALRKASGADVVIVTLGKDGFIGLDHDGFWEMRPPIVEVVDASGAGDAFCAAVGVGIVEGMSIREASRWAAFAAALSVTRQGTIPAFADRHELDEFMQLQKEGGYATI
ncbi:MAG: ribokinase [Anaerolineales bacterium]